ncbi:MAG: cupin [Candidatus Woesearchaeota archaeon]|nr:MAG: cupin [Candidatus Woesearchaeota archaeon]
MYFSNIENETLSNNFFRKVLFTGKNLQLVVMSLNAGEDIGEEVHEHVDQFFRIESGSAKFIVDGKEIIAEKDEVVIVNAGSKHNVINIGTDSLKLYTIYAPPNHPDGTINKDKKEAEEYEKHHH